MGTEYSEQALRALGVFGLTTDAVRDESQSRIASARRRAHAIDRGLRAGEAAMIVGPSASGKSSILRALAGMVPEGDLIWAARPACEEQRVADWLADSGGDLAGALRALSAAGLADAFVPARRIGSLSAGERARLGVARAVLHAESIQAAGRRPTILLDDFGDGLDDATVQGAAHALRRWLRHAGRSRVVIATVRERLGDALCPEVLLDFGSAKGAPHVERATHPASSDKIEIAIGSAADYHALAHLHYRAARPAIVARVLVARSENELAPVAVLAVSMPTLNGAWRPMAWPGEYGNRGRTGRNKRAAARAINRDIRCISRIIVRPQHRGRGVASTLLRRYLRDPLTARTECPSAMGAASPVFVRAGMREWTLGPARRDAPLIDALSAANLAPWMLADVDLAMQRIAQFHHLERALRIWANAHGPTRPLAGGDVREIVRAAAGRAGVDRRAYTAG